MTRKIVKIAVPSITIASDEDASLPVMVCSHERSGTHFLMNSIASNSLYRNDPFLNYDLEPLGSFFNFHYPKDVSLFFTHLATHKCASIVKNHFDAGFFLDVDGKYILRDLCKTIYIARNPIDAMLSYRRFINHLPWHEGPKGLGALDFLNAPPEGRMIRYQTHVAGTILDRWASHVLGWLKVAETEPNVLLVNYDQLDRDHDAVTRKVLRFLAAKCPDTIIRPSPVARTVYVPKAAGPSEADRESVGAYIVKRIGHMKPLSDLLRDLRHPADSQAGYVETD